MWDKFMFLKDLFKIYNKESSDDKDRVIREGPIFIVDMVQVEKCITFINYFHY